MKRYLLRLLAAAIAFAVSIATIYFFTKDKIETWSLWTDTHTVENDSPYSILEGKTVRIKPYQATFEIPEKWLNPKQIPEPAKNLYLSREELSYLYRNDGSDEEDAQVINAVLPFKNCVAHVGDRGWGNYLWNDLQARAYVTDLSADEIFSKIEVNGLGKALSVFEDASLKKDENYGLWQKKTLHITDAPTHFILMKNLDFYIGSFGNKRVVFVFLHAGGFEEAIEGILKSFKWDG